MVPTDEVEGCLLRSSVVADMLEVNPAALVGLGAGPLNAGRGGG